MDASFPEINSSQAISIQKSDQLFLFQLPRNVHITDLNGLKIDISVDATSKLELSNQRKLKSLVKDTKDCRFRPIVQVNNNGVTANKPFVKQIILSDDVTGDMYRDSPTDLNEIDSILIDQAYKAPPQQPDLRVQTVPIGSLSTKEDIAKRAYPHESDPSQRPTKRQRVAFDMSKSSTAYIQPPNVKQELQPSNHSSSTTTSMETDMKRSEKKSKEGKESKKHKKEKKEKKDKKVKKE